MKPVKDFNSISVQDGLKLEKGENRRENEKWCDMSLAEEDLIRRLHRLLGDRWVLIAARLPNRNAEEVEKYWRLKGRKNLKAKVIKPVCVRAKPNLKLAISKSRDGSEASVNS